ncbi:MAG: peptidase M16 [Rhodospirillaceae bacterium]|nr:peptidase M16 [Rhodospirillaceae bacterium]
MLRASKIALCLVLTCVACATTNAAFAKVFSPETFSLKNGLQVVVVSNHRAPVVTQLLIYKVGAMDEPAGKSGVAHFLEHLMFKGTKNLKAGEFSAIVARNGGQENAFTSQDYSGYHQTFAADRLDTMMRIEAERMRNLLLTKKDIEPERKVVLEERNSRVNNNPSALLREEVNAAFYLNHPYRVPVIGWEHEIKALTLEDLVKFYHQWYAPNNAVLIYAGDVSVEKIRPLVEKHYGKIPSASMPKRVVWSEPPQQTDRRITLRHAQVRQPSWSRKIMAPGIQSGNLSMVYALEVLSEIIGGGTTSRLYRSLVVEQKIAVNAGAWYNGYNRGPGSIGFYGTPLQGKSVLDVEAAMTKELMRLLKNGVSEQEVSEAITRLQNAAVYARDGLYAPASIVGEALALGLTLEDVEEWPERIGKIKVKAVNEVIKLVLGRKGSVTAILLPEDM